VDLPEPEHSRELVPVGPEGFEGGPRDHSSGPEDGAAIGAEGHDGTGSMDSFEGFYQEH
jgi:hypothetical protein